MNRGGRKAGPGGSPGESLDFLLAADGGPDWRCIARDYNRQRGEESHRAFGLGLEKAGTSLLVLRPVVFTMTRDPLPLKPFTHRVPLSKSLLLHEAIDLKWKYLFHSREFLGELCGN